MVVNNGNILLDTNIIISAIGFGGKPREIFSLVLEKRIPAVTSAVLLAELEDSIFKKFPLLSPEYKRIERLIRKKFKIVEPKKSLHIVRDEPDNRVLEAAIEGNCRYIVTGDRELLRLDEFRKVKIITASQFLKLIQN